MSEVLAIDPGTTESAYVVMDLDTYKPVVFGKVPNKDMMDVVAACPANRLVLEMIQAFGMPTGHTTFETVFWIGRFFQHSDAEHKTRLYRKTHTCMELCKSARAKDANIIQALKDRFGEKGTRKHPGWFFGFAADVWQAYALAVTYADLLKRGALPEEAT